MMIDDSRFPIVRLTSGKSDEAGAGSSLEHVLERGETFVLISDKAPEPDAHESAEDRRERALFFKRNRERLRALCAASIIVQGDRPVPLPLQSLMKVVGRRLGVRLEFARHDDDALKLARQALAGWQTV